MATRKTPRKKIPLKWAAKKKIVTKKKVAAKKVIAKKKVTAKKTAVKKTASNVIRVPLAAPGSFDPNRPLEKNTLLLNQVRHFQQIMREKGLADPRGGGFPRTEGEAALYLRKATAMLHPEGQETTGTLPPGLLLNSKRGRNA